MAKQDLEEIAVHPEGFTREHDGAEIFFRAPAGTVSIVPVVSRDGIVIGLDCIGTGASRLLRVSSLAAPPPYTEG